MKIFAIDISGSMSAMTVDKIKLHLLSNAERADRVLMFDTAVRKVTTPHDAVYGGAWSSGGGTLLEPVVEWRDENAPDARLVIMSDGYFAAPAATPNAEIMLVDSTPTLANQLSAGFDKVTVL